MSEFTTAGFDTVRVPAGSKADERRRAERDRAARGNLAAMVCDAHGGVEALRGDPEALQVAVSEFAELLDVLGLSVFDRRPGCCRNPGCDEVLPMSAAYGHGTAARDYIRAGYCSPHCRAEAG